MIAPLAIEKPRNAGIKDSRFTSFFLGVLCKCNSFMLFSLEYGESLEAALQLQLGIQYADEATGYRAEVVTGKVSWHGFQQLSACFCSTCTLVLSFKKLFINRPRSSTRMGCFCITVYREQSDTLVSSSKVDLSS